MTSDLQGFRDPLSNGGLKSEGGRRHNIESNILVFCLNTHVDIQDTGHYMSRLTLAGPLRWRSDPVAEGLDGVVQRLGAAEVVTVVWIREAIWRRFVVCLAQQGIEAVVEAGTEANISGVAGAVQRAAVVLLRCRDRAVVLVVVGGLVEVVLLQGGEHGRLVFVH